jgi:hypothetical protein
MYDSGARYLDDDVERLGQLRPEVKLNLAMDLSDACVRVCAEGIKARFPSITEEELVKKLRKRIEWSKRLPRRGV